MKLDFLKLAEDIEKEIIEIRRDIHRNPELGYEEHRTSQKIKEFLKKEGIEYKETAGTGVCGIIRGNGNKTIGIRADIDALPLEDKKSCEYHSTVKGKMHACGHDGHTAILLGVARILNSIKDKLNGNIKLFFEPAEETTGGAKVMIEEGVLENPKVDVVIGLHVDENTQAGKIAIKRGVVNAASNPFNIKIKGKGAHGARPYTGIDPIVIASSVVIALQNIVSREISATDAAVLSIGTIHGGTAENIIPEEVTISGVIRTMTIENRAYVKKRLVEVVEGVVHSMRGQCEIHIVEGYPCLYNNDSILDVVFDSAESVIGKENVNVLENPSLGVESFAYFSMERPSAFYYLGCRNEEKGIVNPAHGSLFDIDEDCLKIGVAMQCKIAYELLNK